MADTTFVDYDISSGNRIVAAWLNDVNNLRYGASSALRGAALLQFIQAGTGATVRTAQAKEREIFSAADFGGDLTVTLAALSAAGGGTLYLPPGTYTTAVGLVGLSNIVIQGSGRDNTTIQLTAAGDLFTFTSTTFFAIKDVTLEGASLNSRAVVGVTVGSYILENVMIRLFKNTAIDISGANSVGGVLFNTRISAAAAPTAGARALKIVAGNAFFMAGCYLNGYDTLVDSTCDSFDAIGNILESSTDGYLIGGGNFVSEADKFYSVTGDRYEVSGNFDTTIVSPRNCTLAQVNHTAMTNKRYLHLVGMEGEGSPVNSLAEPGLRGLRGTVNTTAATIIEGLGFTVAKNATGDVTVTFSIAFSDLPSVTASADRTVGATAIAVLLNATSTTTTCRLLRVDAAGAAEDGYVNFTVVGPA